MRRLYLLTYLLWPYLPWAQVQEYLSTFLKYEYLWQDNMADAYTTFMSKEPTLEDFETELKTYVSVKVRS